jgi:hypothetical protein
MSRRSDVAALNSHSAAGMSRGNLAFHVIFFRPVMRRRGACLDEGRRACLAPKRRQSLHMKIRDMAHVFARVRLVAIWLMAER